MGPLSNAHPFLLLRSRGSPRRRPCVSVPAALSRSATSHQPLRPRYSSTLLHRAGQVCFSKTMLPECAIGFMSLETMVKEAGFVCLPAAAAETKDILRRVHLGQECIELTTMPVTFTTRVHVAKECRRQ